MGDVGNDGGDDLVNYLFTLEIPADKSGIAKGYTNLFVKTERDCVHQYY